MQLGCTNTQYGRPVSALQCRSLRRCNSKHRMKIQTCVRSHFGSSFRDHTAAATSITATMANSCPVCVLAEKLVETYATTPWSRDSLRRTLCMLHPDRRCSCPSDITSTAFDVCLALWRRQPAPLPAAAWVPQTPPQDVQSHPPAPRPNRMGPPALPMGCWSLDRYEQTFGQCSADHPWGIRVWEGCQTLFTTYPHTHWMTDQLHFGYFAAPLRFSKAAAQSPCCPIANPRGPYLYPAVIVMSSMYPGWGVVACVNILMQKSKPWWVHEGFIVYRSSL